MTIRLATAVLVATYLGLAAAPAHATFPGTNGKIAFVDNGEIRTAYPDGSGQTTVTNDPASDASPQWSPDGTQIAFVSNRAGNNDIWLMDADGANPRELTSDAAGDTSPVWSPDGKKILFRSDRDAGGGVELWTMNRDGSNEVQLTNGGPASDGSASWAPDSRQLMFTRSDPFVSSTPDLQNIYTVNVDGSGLIPLTAEPTPTFNHSSHWSPDGSTIAWTQSDGYASEGRTWTMSPSGAGKQLVHGGRFWVRGWAPSAMKILLSVQSGNAGPTTINADGSDERRLWEKHQYPPGSDAFYVFQREVWSPDGRYVTGDRTRCYIPDIPCNPRRIFVVDGAGTTLVEIAEGSSPDWQPIPVNTYPRPQSARPVDVRLVPAYQSCTAPNRTHGPPLAEPSCAPPVPSSSRLVPGSKTNGKVFITALVGDPSTSADEADVRFVATLHDVRVAADRSDFTGTVEGRVGVRITDRDNTPHPGGPGAGTVADTALSFPILCAATDDAAVGATCAVDTTLESLVAGFVKEGRRSVWQLGQVRLHDDEGNVFMRQGVFVP